MSVKKVGITTGGGDCPGLNAVIRAVVTVGKEHYGWEILGIEDALCGLIDLDYRGPRGNCWLELADVRGLLSRGGTILGTSNRSHPFRYVVTDPDGTQRETDVSDLLFENYKKLGLDALVSIGGDGSMDIASKLMDVGLNVVGVPKTIDNDLGATDQTFGFDTAIGIATEALDRIRDTADSHDRVMLVEVMGRDAGWIALHAGIAGGADAILIPEIPYRAEAVARVIKRRRSLGKNYSIIVVAEGAKPEGGAASQLAAKLGEMPRLMGAAHKVAAQLDAHVDADMRVTVLGHIQRGGTPSTFDRVLATRYGVMAAELVQQEQFGKMVALRNDEIVAVDIREACARQKLVDPNSQLVNQARALGICFGE